MTMPREAINKGQIKAIHAAIHALGLDDATYRLMLRERYQVTTCKALSRIQAGLLLDELARKRSPSPPPSPSRGEGAKRRHAWPAPTRQARPDATITEKQQRYLERLFATLGWDQARRDGLCRKVLGQPWPQTNSDMDRVLRVLLPMTRRYPGGYDRAGDQPGRGE
ncbi:MAG: DUF1018 domain-containing protein [Candidatus Methylomirabilis oxyfera]|nr:DUF1018 domain-containing protein [Candidatus Methylomirabilis oxyfera]